MGESDGWYWCLQHGRAERVADSSCPPDDRLGPYESKDAAEHWKERVDARDEKWAREVWLPQAVAAGLKRMAMVTAETGLGKAIAENVVAEIDNHGLSMRRFDSVAAATTWALSGLSERKSA